MSEYKECPIEDCARREENGKNTLLKWLKKNLLMIITLLGVLSGTSLGLLLRKLDLSPTAISLVAYPGELYMRALKLLLLPLLISCLITGSSNIDARLNGKMALRTLIYFFLTSCFNALLGVILAVIIRPGNPDIKVSLNSVFDAKNEVSLFNSLLDLGRNIIADNIILATFQETHTDVINKTIKIVHENNTVEVINKMEKVLTYRSGTNSIGIVFFCVVFGSILGTMGSKGKVVKEFFSTIFDVVMKMVRGVIWVTPFGLCSIIAAKIISLTNIIVVMTQLGWFIFTVLIGILLYQLIFLQLIYFIIMRKNPYKFYWALMRGMLTAFATASSAVALPVNFDILDYDLKINPCVTRFVLPIGCNINLDGTALFLAIASIFMAQMSDFCLETGTLVIIWLTSTLMSFATASVPSGSLVLLNMILSSVGIPLNNLPLLFAIDWLVDRFRTTNNVLGDCYTAAVVEKLSKKELEATNSLVTEFDEISNKLLKISNNDAQIV